MRKDYKDILIGYIQTLSDEDCHNLYFLLTTTGTGYMDKRTWSSGYVKLTPDQYNKLVWMWGKDKTDKCVGILNKWLEKKEDWARNKISHYRLLTTWVEDAYYRKHGGADKSLRYSSEIDTAWKAKKYIEGLPPELRGYDTEARILVNRFGPKILP